jgi:hypothetical protein
MMKFPVHSCIMMPLLWLSVTHLDTTKEPLPGHPDATAVTLRFEVQKPTPCTRLEVMRDATRQHHYTLFADPGSAPCIQIISTDTVTIRDTIHGNGAQNITVLWEKDSVKVEVGE